MKLFGKPKIVGQFIDTLHSAHYARDEEFYYKNFQELIEYLTEQKEIAKEQKAFGVKFKVINNFLELGKFKINSAGVSNYAYVLTNDLISIHISNAKFNNTQFKPQLKIEYRSNFLFDVGYKKAYEYGLEVAKRVLGLETRNTCQRIDLATDIWRVNYNPLDYYRIQSLYQKNKHSPEEESEEDAEENENKTNATFKQYARYYNTTGFQIGSGKFVFRVYNKTTEIQKNLNKSYFKEFWVLNGYREEEKSPVWRHESQFRRQDLKAFFPQSLLNKIDDEVLYIFNILDTLWLDSIKKVRFTNLTDSEVLKITSGEIMPDSIRKTFQRRRATIAKNNEFDFWQMLHTWNNKLLNKDGLVKKHKHFSMPNKFYVKRAFKSYLSQSYKISGGNPDMLIQILKDVDEELQKEDLDIHSYGLLKSFNSSHEVYKALVDEKLSTYDYDFIKPFYKETDFRETFVQLVHSLTPSNNLLEEVKEKFSYYNQNLRLLEFSKEVDFINLKYAAGYKKPKVIETEYQLPIETIAI